MVMTNRRINPSSNDCRAPRQRGRGAKIPSETKKTSKIKKLFKIGVVTFSRARFVADSAISDGDTLRTFFLQRMFFWGTEPFALGASLFYLTFA